MPRSLPVLTNSAEKTWRQCARLYKLHYLDLVRPIHDADALTFGTLVHAGLEAWLKASQTIKTKPCPTCTGGDETGFMCQDCQNRGTVGQDEWLRAALSAVADHADEWRRATVEALLVGYHNRWASMRWEGPPYDGAPIEVLDVEQEFRGPLLNPETGKPSKSLQRGGKIDALIRVGDDVWVLEHKTTSSDFGPGTPYRLALRMDTQVSGYHVGARLLGHHDVKGVLYDVIGKPGLKPLKATPPDKRQYTKPTKNDPIPRLYKGQRETDETIEEYQNRLLESIAGGDYFARFEVIRLGREEESAGRDTWMRAAEIRDAMRLGRFPRNPSSCTAYGRACVMLPICLGEATANDGTRYRRAETAHEELGGERRAA